MHIYNYDPSRSPPLGLASKFSKCSPGKDFSSESTGDATPPKSNITITRPPEEKRIKGDNHGYDNVDFLFCDEDSVWRKRDIKRRQKVKELSIQIAEQYGVKQQQPLFACRLSVIG